MGHARGDGGRREDTNGRWWRRGIEDGAREMRPGRKATRDVARGRFGSRGADGMGGRHMDALRVAWYAVT